MYVYNYPVSFIGLEKYLDDIMENEIRPHIVQTEKSFRQIKPVSRNLIFVYPVYLVIMIIFNNPVLTKIMISIGIIILLDTVYRSIRFQFALKKCRQEFMNKLSRELNAERLVKLDVMRKEKEITGVSLSDHDTLTLLVQIKGTFARNMGQIEVIFEGKDQEIRIVLNEDEDFRGFSICKEPQRKDILIDFNHMEIHVPDMKVM